MSFLRRSPWLLHYDASSCNGCDIEVIACLTPIYDLERFGIINTGNPKHADVLLITGGVNEQNRDVVRTIYEQMPWPKAVVAVGVCAACGNFFRFSYNLMGGIGQVLPVDVYVPGCAARPEAIIDGVFQALEALEEQHRRQRQIAARLPAALEVGRAGREDAERILELELHENRYEAEIYNDYGLIAAAPTQAEILERMDTTVFLKAAVDDQVLGTARAELQERECVVSGLAVDFRFRHRGIQAGLLAGVEDAFPDAPYYVLELRHAGRRALRDFRGHGYLPVRAGGAWEAEGVPLRDGGGPLELEEPSAGGPSTVGPSPPAGIRLRKKR
jgi:ech hydrogenase subunit C